MSIERAREALKEKARAGQLTRLDPIERAKLSPGSLRRAVNAKCFDCQGQDADPCGAWRIGNCEIATCPLWPVRPHQHLFGKPTPVALLSSMQFGHDEPDDTRLCPRNQRSQVLKGDSPVTKNSALPFRRDRGRVIWPAGKGDIHG